MHKGKITMLGRIMAGSKAVIAHNENGHAIYAEYSPPDIHLNNIVSDYCERSVFDVTEGQIIPIDGKTLRRSYDRSSGKAAVHMTSAWASENGIKGKRLRAGWDDDYLLKVLNL
ncbi:MAG: hypothetical protein GY749_23160 [Desulfobacteraceae bacterium]|nr:hypothetical protein [Desulfobacteraceae bacterium]